MAKERRDLTILQTVIADGPIGMVKLSDRTDVPEHKVRYSLRMLESDGFVEPTPEGAVPADDVVQRLERVNEGVDQLIGRLERVRDDEVVVEEQ